MADISAITLPNNTTYDLKDATARSALDSKATVTVTTATLTPSGWSSNAQTVTVSGVTASNTVLVSYAPSDKALWTDADIYCYSQASNSLTFRCTTAPSSNVTVNVMIVE